MTAIVQHEHLIDYAISLGFLVSVYDGESWPVKHSIDRYEIIAAIDNVEEATIRIRNRDHVCLTNVLVIDEGIPDETIVDYVVCSFMETWVRAYRKAVREEDG